MRPAAATQPEPYRTTDIYYAAYLRVAGVQFLESIKEGNRVYFLFEQTGNIRDLKNQYFNRVAKVSAFTFVDEIRAMKQLTHMEG